MEDKIKKAEGEASKARAQPKDKPEPTATPAPSPKIQPETAVKIATGVAAAGAADSVLAKIKRHEGLERNKNGDVIAYHDPKYDKNGQILEDHYSIGYGHQITKKEIKYEQYQYFEVHPEDKPSSW